MKTDKRELILFFTALAAVNMLIIVWSIYDHALPVYDMAWNLLCGLNCSDLLMHAHLRSIGWWRSLLSVNPLYPPFVYLVYGVLKLFCGPWRWVDVLVHILFSTILFSAMYGLGKLIFKSSPVAFLSAIIIFAYPSAFLFSHYDMLDGPGLAMVCLALFSLTWWQQSPSYYSSFVLGIACSLAALTKNNCIAFILVPLVVSLILSIRKKDWIRVRSLSLAILPALALIVPWLFFASWPMLKAINYIQEESSKAGCAHMFSFKDNFLYYLFNITSLFSTFLLIIFIIAFIRSNKIVHWQMCYLSLSAITGILLLSLFHWVPLYRYILPVLIPAALYTAQAVVHCWTKTKFHLIIIILAALTCFSFVETNFSPYPIQQVRLPDEVLKFFGIPPLPKELYYVLGCTNYPMAPTDWGHDWVLETIKPQLDNRVQTMAIMSNTAEVSAATYTYLAKRDKLSLCVFTPREWTMAGEDICFRSDFAKQVNWYLLESKDSVCEASHLSGPVSRSNYLNWCSFIRTSTQFKLLGSRQLPDGNKLELYKNLLN